MIAIMTEEEARKRWCPMTPIGYADEVKEFTCIASNCMMWRWEICMKDTATGEIEPFFPSIGYTDRWESVTEKYGFCGLAGKP